jgi:hypothetical protein
MRKMVLLAGLTCLVGLTAVHARMIAPPPVTTRTASADVVVVGKAISFGDKLVAADLFKGDTRQMQVARVKVEETILGRGGREIQVGFIPAGGARLGRRFPTAQLAIGQEACLFLTRHPSKKDVYVLNNFYDVLNRKDNLGFAKELEDVKRAAKLLTSPTAGLKAKNADDRFETAGLRRRTSTRSPPRRRSGWRTTPARTASPASSSRRRRKNPRPPRAAEQSPGRRH